ncbi:zinc finger BED domain-containing protein RICESLEEPER 2 [Tanacetum coccineum]
MWNVSGHLSTDETIDVETIGNEDKKRKRKAPSNPRKPKAECWKYFDQKFEKDEDRVITKMAYCKWCSAVFKSDCHRHGNKKKIAFKKRFVENDVGGTNGGTLENVGKYDEKNSCFARDLEETPKRADFEVCRKVVQFLEKFKETTELVSNVSSPVAHLWFGEVLDIDKHLREWQANAHFKDMIVDMRKKYDKYWGDYKKINHYMYFAVILDPTMKSEIIGYGFKHLIENGCMPMEQDEEDSQETPFQFLTPDELCAKFVEKVEKAMGLLFAIYKEKYGTSTSSDLPRSMSNKSTSSRSRRGNAFINSFKDKVGNKLSGCEDELKKYLKEPRLELEEKREQTQGKEKNIEA